jgi:hypothetical protein
MPAYGTGLSSQIMLAAETTVGTAVTTTTAYEFLNENFVFAPTDLDGQGLKSGQAYERLARHVRARIDVNGDFTVEHADKGHMGLLWKHALGSPLTAPVVIGATTAYDQYHVPGSRTGLGLTVQTGQPQPNATVIPFTWSGGKITQWDFSVTDNAIAQLKLTMDAWNLDTAPTLTTAAYSATAGVFTFKDAATFKIGGTPSTTAGKTTIAAGSTVSTLFSAMTLTGANPMKVDRYGLGNAGVKKEQLENAIPMITGTLDGEFTSRSEIFDLYKSNTATALQIDFTHFDGAGNDAGGVAAGPNPYLLSFIFPAVKFTSVTDNTGGPDVVAQKVAFKAFDDGSGTNPVLQVHLVSTDTTL